MPIEKETVDAGIPEVVTDVKVPQTPEEIAAQNQRIKDLEKILDEDSESK